MVYQGLLICWLFLGGLCAAELPPELAEADALVHTGRYVPAAISFLQYRLRFPEHETYCTERAAYCLVQTGETGRALRLLRDFDGRAPEPDTPHVMVGRTRLRALLAYLYDRADDPRRALQLLRRNPTFDTHAERNLHLLARLALEEEIEGVNVAHVRRQLLTAILMSPPGTPGRWSLFQKFIEYGGDKLPIAVEKIISRNYFYNQMQKNNQQFQEKN
jgi:hypothetical protein